MSGAVVTAEMLSSIDVMQSITKQHSSPNNYPHDPSGQTPPVLAMVRKPVRTLLAGEELAAHQREMERVKRLKEENAQRKRREEELAAVSDSDTLCLPLFLVFLERCLVGYYTVVLSDAVPSCSAFSRDSAL